MRMLYWEDEVNIHIVILDNRRVDAVVLKKDPVARLTVVVYQPLDGKQMTCPPN